MFVPTSPHLSIMSFEKSDVLVFGVRFDLWTAQELLHHTTAVRVCAEAHMFLH
jgi:hypothetical protein